MYAAPAARSTSQGELKQNASQSCEFGDPKTSEEVYYANNFHSVSQVAEIGTHSVVARNALQINVLRGGSSKGLESHISLARKKRVGKEIRELFSYPQSRESFRFPMEILSNRNIFAVFREGGSRAGRSSGGGGEFLRE